jgi:hypothetical protein
VSPGVGRHRAGILAAMRVRLSNGRLEGLNTITGTLCRGSHTGVIAEGAAFYRQPGVLRAPGLGCSLSSHSRNRASLRESAEFTRIR